MTYGISSVNISFQTRFNVVQLASEQFQNLYKCLEVEFDPLNLCTRVKSVTEVIAADENNILNQYIQSLHDVTLVRLIRQISQVYQTIEFTRILALAKFTNPICLERILVDCVRHNDMQIRIDHQEKCIHFGSDLSESQREDNPDGPTLQSMPSEQIRSQLVNMSIVLHRAIAAINPSHNKPEREKLRTQMVKNYEDNKHKEHSRILQRQKIIEDRKEFIERLNIEREEEELRRQEEISRQQKMAEQKRLELEIEERERKRHANEIQLIKEKSLKEKMQQISQTAHGQKVLKKLDEDEIKKLDAEQIAAKEAEELIKERKELQSKLKSQEKKIDYFERAKRIDEIPLIDKFLAQKTVQDKEFWEKQEQSRIENTIAERKNAVQQQDRLKRMHPDRDIFLDQLRTERNSMFVEKIKAFDASLEEERKKRMAQRVLDRKEERRQKWKFDKEEEVRRREEEIQKAKEEEEKVERERRAKEREIENEKLRIQGEKQRAKEDEAERKIQEDREALSRLPPKEKEQPSSSWRTANERGGDRDRVRSDRDRGDKDSTTATEGDWRSGGQKPSDPWRAKREGGDARGSNVAAEGGNWRNDRDSDRKDFRRRDDRDFGRGDRSDRGGERGGDRGGERGGDRGGERGGERGGDRGGERGGDRVGDRGGDRGDRGGDRDRFGGGRRDAPRGDNDRGAWRRRDDDRGEIRRGGGGATGSGQRGTASFEGNWRTERPREEEKKERKPEKGI